MIEIVDWITTQLSHSLEILWALSEWLFVTVFVKYIFAKYIAEKIKQYLTRRRDDAISWEHYRLRAKGHGHNYDSPEECPDGACHFIKKETTDLFQRTNQLF